MVCVRNRYCLQNSRWITWRPCPRTRYHCRDCQCAILYNDKQIYNIREIFNFYVCVIYLYKKVIIFKIARALYIPPSFLISVFSPGLILALAGRPDLCESGAGVAAISPSQRRSRAHSSPRIASRSTSWESAERPCKTWLHSRLHFMSRDIYTSVWKSLL